MKLLSKNWKLFTLMGVPVKLHISFLPILALVLLFQPQFIVLFMLLVGSVLAHEYGHIYASRAFGGTCDAVYLHAFGGAALISPPKAPKETLLVSLAGPITSVLLAILFYVMYYVTGMEILKIMGFINALMGVFNLLPIFPMDGGRIFRVGAEHVLGKRRGRVATLHLSRTLSVLGLVACVFYGLYFMAAMAALLLAFTYSSGEVQ